MEQTKGMELARAGVGGELEPQDALRQQMTDLLPLFNAAQEGDSGAAYDVFKGVDAVAPDGGRAVAEIIVRQYVDVVGAILNQWLEDNELAKQAVRVKMDGDRKRLLGEHPTPLEELLVDEVVVSWLLHAFARSQVARHAASAPKVRDVAERSLDRAQRRYLGAIKMLATIRRLQIPAVQLNVGDKQINVVGSVHAGSAALQGGGAQNILAPLIGAVSTGAE